jgi:hypothetical protein
MTWLLLLSATRFRVRQVQRGDPCLATRIGQKLVENVGRPVLTERELDILDSVKKESR